MTHLADADYIRLRDGECDGAEERAFRGHMAACAECGENARKIDRLVEGLVSAVEEIEYPKAVQLPHHVIARRRQRRKSKRVFPIWLTRHPVQVAAALVIVVTLAFTTAPARAVVKSGWQAIVGFVSGEPTQRSPSESAQQPTPVPADSADAQPMAKRASFVPQTDEFSIVLDHPQSAGTLLVTVENVGRATIVALGDAESDELVVFRAGVRISNTEASTASYELTLPSNLRRVVVQMAGQTVATLSPEELLGRGAWRLDLASAGAR